MGIRAGITVISADVVEQIAAGIKPDVGAGGNTYTLDKAWQDLHIVFKDQGAPLRYAISGDCVHPDSPQSFDEFCEGSHDFYFGFMSPQLVSEIETQLLILDAPHVQRLYTKAGVGGYDRDGTYFNNLKAAYVEAASLQCGLMIGIG